jgi:hypothetical protein
LPGREWPGAPMAALAFAGAADGVSRRNSVHPTFGYCESSVALLSFRLF